MDFREKVVCKWKMLVFRRYLTAVTSLCYVDETFHRGHRGDTGRPLLNFLGLKKVRGHDSVVSSVNYKIIA